MQVKPFLKVFFMVMVLVLSMTIAIPFSVLADNPSEYAVSPPSGIPGATFSFYATNFDERERVSYWFNDPNGDVVGSAEYRVMSYEGRADWEWKSPDNAMLGSWMVVAEGRDSNTKHVIPFEIIDPSQVPQQAHAEPVATAQPTPTPLPLPSGDESLETLPPNPPGVAVDPPADNPGGYFSFYATGFASREQVVYVAVDALGREIDDGYHTTISNPEGRADWTWQTPYNAVHGVWVMVAKGDESGTEQRIYFEIRDMPTSNTTVDTTDDSQAATSSESNTVQNASDVAVEPAASNSGARFSFYAHGFLRRETVRFWATDPGGKTYEDGEYEVTANVDGRADWSWKTPQDAMPGVWNMVARGKKSFREKVVHFQVLSNEEIASQAVPVTVHSISPQAQTVNVPENATDVSVNPTSGQPGSSFDFFARGFKRLEQIRYWVFSPDGQVAEGTSRVVSSAHMHATWAWQAPADAPHGTWTMVGKGTKSHIEKVIYFQVGSSSAAQAAQPAAVPAPVAAGIPANPPGVGVEPPVAVLDENVAFFVEGFPAHETVHYWLMTPSGDEYRKDDYKTGTTPEGRADWKWKVPNGAGPGIWTMVVLGEHSGLKKEIFFKVVQYHDDQGADVLAAQPSQGSGTPVIPGGPVNPPGVGVEPAIAMPDDEVAFFVSGFPLHETVYYWAIDPNGLEYRNNEHKAGTTDQGRADWKWKVPSGPVTGIWTMVAEGDHSGERREIFFAVSRPGEDITANGASGSSGKSGVEPEIANPDQKIAFFAAGLPLHDTVKYWVIDPDGIIDESSEYKTGPNDEGRADWTWRVPTIPKTGTWTMVVVTDHSDYRQEIAFQVINPDSDAPVQPGNTTPATSSAPGLPPDTRVNPPNVGVDPAIGKPDEKIAFYVAEYPIDETIEYHFLDPDGYEYTSDNYKTGTNDIGRADWTWKVPTEAKSGNWTMVVVGEHSEEQREVYFQVFNPPENEPGG